MSEDKPPFLLNGVWLPQGELGVITMSARNTRPHGAHTREDYEAALLRDIQNCRVAIGDCGPVLARAAALIVEMRAVLDARAPASHMALDTPVKNE